MAKTNNLRRRVIVIIQDYLGPAGERFVDRLIEFHLKKSPEELQVKDIEKLSGWIKVSLGLLTEDRLTVDECEKRILKLARR